eukprot:gene4125-4522_t
MASKDYCHFNDNDDNTNFHLSLFGYHLTILQSPGDRQLGHGAVVWDASVVFAKYMENNLRDFSPSKLNGQQVLELGSGCGLAGGAYLLRGAQVTFTDLQPVLTSLTIPNTTRIYSLARQYPVDPNNITTIFSPIVLPLDWRYHNPIDDLHAFQSKYDYILLTDCIFAMDLLDDLIAILLYFSTPKTTIICCHEIRDEGINAAFVEKLKEHFSLKHIAKNKLHPDYSNEFISIIYAKLLRKK